MSEEPKAVAKAAEVEAATPEQLPQTPQTGLTLVERVRIARDVFTIVAFAIAGVWAATTFWYHSWYLPAHEKPIVTPTLTLTVLGEKDGRVAINAHLVLKNGGNATQPTWGMSFHAFAQKITFAPSTDGGWSTLAEGKTGLGGLRDFRQEPPVLIASSIDLMTDPGRNNPIQPHAELDWDFYFYADRAAADVVNVEFHVLYPEENIPVKAEWFTLKHEGDKPVRIVRTDSCKADPACRVFSIDGERQLSLWSSHDHSAR